MRFIVKSTVDSRIVTLVARTPSLIVINQRDLQSLLTRFQVSFISSCICLVSEISKGPQTAKSNEYLRVLNKECGNSDHLIHQFEPIFD